MGLGAKLVLPTALAGGWCFAQHIKDSGRLVMFSGRSKRRVATSAGASSAVRHLLCVEPSQVARIHGTSGTTGRPVVFGISTADWERIANSHARIMWGAGLRP